METGRERVILKDVFVSAARSVAFSLDGKSFAAGTGTWIALWEVATGKLLRTFQHGDQIFGLDFSPDGKTLASSGLNVNSGTWPLVRKKLPSSNVTTVPTR